MNVSSAAVLSFLGLAMGPALAEPADARLGEIRVNFDDESWHADRLAEGELLRLFCIAADCPVLDEVPASLYMIARPASPDGVASCDSALRSVITRNNNLGGFTYERTTYAGIEFRVTGLGGACGRLSHPVLLQACGERDGTIYWLTTGFNACMPEARLPKARLDEILQGLSEGPSAPQ